MSHSQNRISALPWRHLWGVLGVLFISLGSALAVRANSTTYNIGTTVLMSKVLEDDGSYQGADQVANYASVT